MTAPRSGQRRDPSGLDSPKTLRNPSKQALGNKDHIATNTGGRTAAPNKVQSATKTSAQTSGVVLVEQAHGGALQIGNPGNAGGGRRPDHVRQLATTLSYEEAIPALRRILADPTSTKGEVTSAAKAILDLVPRKDELDITSTPQYLDACLSYGQLVEAIVREECPEGYERVRAKIAQLQRGPEGETV